MRASFRSIPKLYLQWVSPAGEGLALELCEGTATGELAKDGLYPVATILADEAEVLWMEIYSENGAVRMPLQDIERAIAIAKIEVHGEEFYDHGDSPDET